MCLLNEKMFIDRKCAYWKMKMHKCFVFLNVYVALIYVAMWCNEVWSTKSQTFHFYIILAANSRIARDNNFYGDLIKKKLQFKLI